MSRLREGAANRAVELGEKGSEEQWAVFATNRHKLGAALKLCAPHCRFTGSAAGALTFRSREAAEEWAEKARGNVFYASHRLTVDRIA